MCLNPATHEPETTGTTAFPAYLNVAAENLGQGTPVAVRVRGDATDLAREMASAMLSEIQEVQRQGRAATLIVPVGPVDQYPRLVQMINQQRIDCRQVMFINMDEYLTETDEWLAPEHPLSFRGYMERSFYQRLRPELAPAPENRVFPKPENPAEIGRIIAARGGVDACFGGIGINGHIAFNEPPEAPDRFSVAAFSALPTRVLDLTRETRTINSHTVGGEISLIPRRAITVGMREILAARRLRFYCNRPWQSAVVRRVLHGPITPLCPASLLRLHRDAMLTVTDFVAAPPDIRLR